MELCEIVMETFQKHNLLSFQACYLRKINVMLNAFTKYLRFIQHFNSISKYKHKISIEDVMILEERYPNVYNFYYACPEDKHRMNLVAFTESAPQISIIEYHCPCGTTHHFHYNIYGARGILVDSSHSVIINRRKVLAWPESETESFITDVIESYWATKEKKTVLRSTEQTKDFLKSLLTQELANRKASNESTIIRQISKI